MENKTKIENIYSELRELARQEVMRELKQRFTKEGDFESLRKLEEWEKKIGKKE